MIVPLGNLSPFRVGGTPLWQRPTDLVFLVAPKRPVLLETGALGNSDGSIFSEAMGSWDRDSLDVFGVIFMYIYI